MINIKEKVLKEHDRMLVKLGLNMLSIKQLHDIFSKAIDLTLAERKKEEKKVIDDDFKLSEEHTEELKQKLGIKK